MEFRSLVEEFIINYGLISIFIVVALEYANLPLPSELVLPLVGIFAFKYNMNFTQVVTISILGGITGCIVNYYLGYKFGKPLIEIIIGKFPKTEKSVMASYSWIKKYDKISVMISRVVPVARTFISIVAGVIKMNIITFIIYSTIGIGIWNLALISAGYLLGHKIHIITTILKQYSLLVCIIAVIFTIVYIIKSRIKKTHKDT